RLRTLQRVFLMRLLRKSSIPNFTRSAYCDTTQFGAPAAPAAAQLGAAPTPPSTSSEFSLNGAQLAAGPGLITWQTDPEHPFAATPAFVSYISNTPQEVALASTIIMISNGNYPIRETGIASDSSLNLPGGNRTMYNIYSVGPPDNPGPERIANSPGSNIYYYSPYHYNPGPGVPNAWIQIIYGPSPKG
ncbi:hypothetical protein AAKU58_004384, partial [Oxalobacteraceae bacterium GrIS 1.18]